MHAGPQNPGRRPLCRAGMAALLALTGWTGAAWSAPVTFNTALPVAEGEFVFREQFVLDQSGDDPSGADRERTAWAGVWVLGYGVNSDLTLFGIVPYVDKRLELTEGAAGRIIHLSDGRIAKDEVVATKRERALP